MGWTITTIVALVLLFFAGQLALRQHRWLRQARTTQGTVVSFRRSVGAKGRPTYYPRVSFTGSNGRTHECEGKVASNPPDFKVGEAVAVAYQPETSEGRILTFGQCFGFAAALASLALALLVAVVVFRGGAYFVPRIYLSGGQGW